MASPRISVVMPVRQEARYLQATIESLIPQIEACDGELIVAEGESTDRTPQILEELSRKHSFVRVVENPGGHPATGLNAAISIARGEVILRADAHSHYAPDYVERSLAVLAQRGPRTLVGGRLEPRADSRFGRAVAEVMTSPMGVGTGAFHHAAEPQFADTVYLGAFQRQLIEAVGGYRAFRSRAGEDADFCARIRRAGFSVWLDPSIRSTYQPRETPSSLASQSWRYGLAKAEILMASGALPSWRPLAPAALVLVLLRAAAASSLHWSRLLSCSWIGALWWGGRQSRSATDRLLFVGAAGIMQISYGGGFWAGLLRGRRGTRPLTGEDAGWTPELPSLNRPAPRPSTGSATGAPRAVVRSLQAPGRTNLGLFAALSALLLPTVFAPSVDAPFWTPKMALLLVVAAVGTVYLLAPAPPERRRATWAARAFLAVAATSTALSSNPDLALLGLWNQGTGLLFIAGCTGAWAIGLRLNASDRSLLRRSLLLAAALNIAVVITQMAFDLSAFGFIRFFGRASGLLQSPVFVGPLVAASVALLIPWIARQRQPVLYLGMLPFGVALGLSGGRGAALLAVAVAAWAWRSHGWTSAGGVVMALAVGVVLAPGLDRPLDPVAAPLSQPAAVQEEAAAPVREPTGLTQNRPLSPRFATWWSARHAVMDAPFIGAGPGQFRSATIHYRPAAVSADTPDRHFTDAHNFLVEHAVTTGVLGLLALLAWLALAGWRASGSLGVFAAVLGFAHLFQPENVGTTPLALLALGAAWAVDAEPRRLRVAPILTGALGAVVAGLLLYGAAALRVAELDLDIASARRAGGVLRGWPQAPAREGLIHQYRWAIGREASAAAARRSFAEAAAREPDHPLRWVVLAEVAGSHGKTELSHRALRRAFDLDPRSARARETALRRGFAPPNF